MDDSRRRDMQGYRQLDVWKKAMTLVVEIYHLTHVFPHEERFGLTSQMRRAAVSIPSNLAEGHGRANTGDYRRHVAVARGSVAELETQIELAMRLDMATRDAAAPVWQLTQQVAQMLTRLHQSLERKRN